MKEMTLEQACEIIDRACDFIKISGLDEDGEMAKLQYHVRNNIGVWHEKAKERMEEK